MSPYDRERYESRPRYEDQGTHTEYHHSIFLILRRFSDTYRGNDRSPPRGRDHRHGAGSRPYRTAPPDPHTFDAPATLKQYADWFRYYFPQQAIDEDQADKLAEQEAGDGSRPRNGIKSRWEQYKKDFLQKQVSSLSLSPVMLPSFSIALSLTHLFPCCYLNQIQFSYRVLLNDLYDSFRSCSTTTESRRGLLRDMTPSSQTCGPECERSDGEVG